MPQLNAEKNENKITRERKKTRNKNKNTEKQNSENAYEMTEAANGARGRIEQQSRQHYHLPSNEWANRTNELSWVKKITLSITDLRCTIPAIGAMQHDTSTLSSTHKLRYQHRDKIRCATCATMLATTTLVASMRHSCSNHAPDLRIIHNATADESQHNAVEELLFVFLITLRRHQLHQRHHWIISTKQHCFVSNRIEW